MGKKSKHKNNIKKQRAKHIVAGLYKIKEINHKIKYTYEKLQVKVLKSPHGKKVIEELKAEGITKRWLRLQGKDFAIAYFLLGCQLD